MILLAVIAITVVAFAGTAQAAGKPGFAGGGEELRWEMQEPSENTFNSVNTPVRINPNGALTTVAFEYRELPSTEKYTVFATKSISGTSTVPLTANLAGGPLSPGNPNNYFVRVTATNSYGSSSIETPYHLRPSTWAAGAHSANYLAGTASTGTFRLEATAGTVAVKWECHEEGTGQIQVLNIGGSQKMTISNCKQYQNGKFICTSPEPSTTLNFTNSFNTSNLFPFRCSAEEAKIAIGFTRAFVAKLDSSLSQKTHSVTLTYKDSEYYHGTVTIETLWSLTGVDVGSEFQGYNRY